jgi:small subunit ribosomal protein S3e
VLPPQFVADGVFFAELNEVLTRELAEDGYSGVEVRVTPMRTEIIIRATRTQNVLGLCSFPSPLLVLCCPWHQIFHLISVFVLAVSIAGEKGRRIRELTSLVQKRFNFPEGTVELYAEKVNNRGLCAIAQAESLRYKLLGGLAVRRYLFGFSGLFCFVRYLCAVAFLPYQACLLFQGLLWCAEVCHGEWC